MAKLNRSQKKHVENFMNVANCSEKEATECLTATSWNAEAAFEYWFASGRAAQSPAPEIEALFAKYKDPDDDKILAGGVMEFGTDLGVDVMSDEVILALSYKMDAKRMGEYTKEEFVKGMTSMRAKSIADVKARLPELRKNMDDKDTLRKIYNYTFMFSREKDTDKVLLIDNAVALWTLLLGKRWALCEKWCNFYKNSLDSREHKIVTKDLWAQLYEFSTNIKPDLSNYDLDGAWSCAIDTFVEEIMEAK